MTREEQGRAFKASAKAKGLILSSGERCAKRFSFNYVPFVGDFETPADPEKLLALIEHSVQYCLSDGLCNLLALDKNLEQLDRGHLLLVEWFPPFYHNLHNHGDLTGWVTLSGWLAKHGHTVLHQLKLHSTPAG